MRDAHEILNLITGADAETLRTIAMELARQRRLDALSILAATAHSSQPQHLRSRCLEVLALVASQADRATVDAIMTALAEHRPRRGRGD